MTVIRTETPTDIAFRAMAEKITWLELHNSQLRQELEQLRSTCLEDRLTRLRLFGIALAWVPDGYSRDETVAKLREELGASLWNTLAPHIFDLAAIIKDPKRAQEVAHAFLYGEGKLC